MVKNKNKDKDYEENGFGKEELAYFLIIVFAIVMIFSIFAFAAFYGYSRFKSVEASTPSNPFGNEEQINAEKEEEEAAEEAKEEVQEITSFLIFGTDRAAHLADTIMVGTFNASTCAIEIMSIPRDTFTYFDDREKAQLLTAGWGSYDIPTKTKMNSVYSFGHSLGKEFMRDHIESFLQEDIDYVVTLDTYGFVDIVDAIGGIDYDVPCRMYKTDPTQDLYIDLYPGMQHLDGDGAEGVVRFRDYPEGDLQRVEVQQDFFKEVMRQLLTKDALLNDPIALFEVFLEYVDTDFGITDAMKYVQYIDDISMDNVNFFTMPIASQDPTYVYPDYEELEVITDRMFHGEVETTVKMSAKEATIQILNGSNVDGLASKTQEVLIDDGYNVKNIGDYRGEIEEKTVIKVRKGFDATELLEYFDDAVIREDNKIADYLDIIIVLGIEEDGEIIQEKLE
ncbi:MAG: LCP family protein [Lachnospirales bacterium]